MFLLTTDTPCYCYSRSPFLLSSLPHPFFFPPSSFLFPLSSFLLPPFLFPQCCKMRVLNFGMTSFRKKCSLFLLPGLQLGFWPNHLIIQIINCSPLVSTIRYHREKCDKGWSGQLRNDHSMEHPFEMGLDWEDREQCFFPELRKPQVEFFL